MLNYRFEKAFIDFKKEIQLFINLMLGYFYAGDFIYLRKFLK